MSKLTKEAWNAGKWEKQAAAILIMNAGIKEECAVPEIPILENIPAILNGVAHQIRNVTYKKEGLLPMETM